MYYSTFLYSISSTNKYHLDVFCTGQACLCMCHVSIKGIEDTQPRDGGGAVGGSGRRAGGIMNSRLGPVQLIAPDI